MKTWRKRAQNINLYLIPNILVGILDIPYIFKNVWQPQALGYNNLCVLCHQFAVGPGVLFCKFLQCVQPAGSHVTSVDIVLLTISTNFCSWILSSLNTYDWNCFLCYNAACSYLFTSTYQFHYRQAKHNVWPVKCRSEREEDKIWRR